jgi:hypothetical protein
MAMTGSGADEFAAQLDQFKSYARESAVMLYAGIVLEGYRRIVQKTPVDTGRARANWMVGSEPRTDTVEADETKMKVRKVRKRKDARKQAAAEKMARRDALRSMFRTLTNEQQQEAIGFVRGLNLQTASYIVNNLDYIEALENGHSGQAPMGMVEVTLNELKLIAEQQSAELFKATGTKVDLNIGAIGIDIEEG